MKMTPHLETVRNLLDSCAGSTDVDAAYAALDKIMELLRWGEAARIHLEEMMRRDQQHGDYWGEMESAHLLTQHPETLEMCLYGDGCTRCRVHQLGGGSCINKHTGRERDGT